MKTIELTAEHEHEGCVCLAGSELTLSDTFADWLISIGKGRPPAVKPSNPARASTLKAIESNQDKEQQA